MTNIASPTAEAQVWELEKCSLFADSPKTFVFVVFVAPANGVALSTFEWTRTRPI
jgi:hypothetical protein